MIGRCLGVFWVCLGLMGCVTTSGGTGDMQHSKETKTVQFDVSGGPVTVSPADLWKIQMALREALRTRAQESPNDYSPLLAEFDAVSGWSDRGGLHFGPWELRARKTNLVLVRRPPPTPTRLFHVAFLERQTAQEWRVARMEVEAVRPL